MNAYRNSTVHDDQRLRTAQKVTMTGLLANLLLTIFKYLAGVLGRSYAMVADATHSLSDIITDVIVLLGVNMASKPVDEDHAYGHGKIETLSAVLVAVSLALVGAGIVWSSLVELIRALKGDAISRPGWIAFAAAVISVAIKEWMYRYTVLAGEKIDSRAMIANAWHHRTDAFSSMATMLGIGGAIMLGEKWRVLDPIAALLVSYFILKTAFSMTAESVNELIDGSLSDQEKERIMLAINAVPGAMNPHSMKTRKVGGKVAVDIHIEVPRDINVVKAHDISTMVEKRIEGIFGKGTFVSVHVEPAKPERHIA